MAEKKSEKEIIKAHRKRMGSLGGKETLRRHGPDHFSKLAKKRWKKRD